GTTSCRAGTTPAALPPPANSWPTCRMRCWFGLERRRCRTALVQLPHDHLRAGARRAVLAGGERAVPGGVLAGRPSGGRGWPPPPGVRARRGGGGGRGVPAAAGRGGRGGGVRGGRPGRDAGAGGPGPVAGRGRGRVPRGRAA